jgi:hypothetical protein
MIYYFCRGNDRRTAEKLATAERLIDQGWVECTPEKHAELWIRCNIADLKRIRAEDQAAAERDAAKQAARTAPLNTLPPRDKNVVYPSNYHIH